MKIKLNLASKVALRPFFCGKLYIYMKTTLIGLAVAVGLSLPVSGFEAVLTDDTAVVLSGTPYNFGARPVLPLDAKHNALFAFDLSSIPTGTTSSKILSATLTVFVDAVIRPGSVTLSAPNQPWTEDTMPKVTFTSLVGAQVAVIPVNARNNFVRFDVTGLVKKWIDAPADNFGVALNVAPGGSTVSLGLDSKENTATGHPAALSIELVQQPSLASSSKGAWDAGTAYQAGDIVGSGGSSWIATAANSNSLPAAANTNWTLLAAKGDPGTAVTGGLMASAVTVAPAGYSDTSLTFANWTRIATNSALISDSTHTYVGLFHVGNYLYAVEEGDRLYQYDPSSNLWTPKAALPTAHYGAYASIGGKLFAIGGGSNIQGGVEVDAYDPGSDSSTAKANTLSTSAVRAAAAVGGKIYSFNGPGSPMEVYDPVQDLWVTTANPAQGYLGLFVAAVNGKIYGYGYAPDRSNPILEYDPATDTWSTKNLYFSHVNIVAGDDGGLYYIEYLDANVYVLMRYDPEANASSLVVSVPLTVGFGDLSACMGDILYSGGYAVSLNSIRHVFLKN